MGTKRPHSSADDIHPDRAGRFDAGPAQKKYKQARTSQVDSEGSLAAVKKRARNIERSLQREGASEMPPTVRAALDRELAALKHRIENQQDKKHRSNMIGKYHMVRFFERKKAQKLVNYVRKKLDQTEDPEQIAELKKDLHTAEVDVKYAIYFPFLERYVSLYPNTENPENQSDAKLALLRSKRSPVWTEVEQAVELGESALERLQNRKPSNAAMTASKSKNPNTPGSAKTSDPKDTTTSKKQAALPSKAKSDKAKDDESGNESDTGFFN